VKRARVYYARLTKREARVYRDDHANTLAASGIMSALAIEVFLWSELAKHRFKLRS
jgi:hypothetical protein